MCENIICRDVRNEFSELSAVYGLRVYYRSGGNLNKKCNFQYAHSNFMKSRRKRSKSIEATINCIGNAISASTESMHYNYL